MNRFWGDETWQEDSYVDQGALFGEPLRTKKRGNVPIVRAFQRRLKEVAGFPFVTSALEMRNEEGAIVYYLVGASQKEVAVKIFNAVFRHYRHGRMKQIG
jgi:hypothetical protein